MSTPHEGIRIGWGMADLTPNEPVLLTGQLHAHVSEAVLDPVTAKVLRLIKTREMEADTILTLAMDDRSGKALCYFKRS